MTNHKPLHADATGITPSTPSTQTPAVSNTQRPLDANGHNPDDYDWVPVPRRRRSDGWTPEKQREFIAILADCGSVSAAARQVGMSKNSCYRLRRSKDATAFAVAWDAAIGQASRLLADEAFDRALNGTEHHVIDKDGNHIYTHVKLNDRLLMFLLRSHQPQLYGRGAERVQAVDESGSGVVDAIEKLVPAPPENPEALLDHWEEQWDDQTPAETSSDNANEGE